MKNSKLVERCTLIIVLVLSLFCIGAGIEKWKDYEDSDDRPTVVFLVAGGIMTIVIVIVYTIITCYKRGNVSPPPTAMPFTSTDSADPPPKYNLTWRKEYLQRSSSSPEEDLEQPRNQQAGDGKYIWSEITHTVWTTGVEQEVDFRVHEMRPSSFVLEEQGNVDRSGEFHSIIRKPLDYRDSSTSKNPTLWTSVIIHDGGVQLHDYDEGLPTYEELNR